jgi:outer membrane lipoprotein SlyB
MSNQDLTKQIEVILEKRKNCIPLSNAEDTIVNKFLNDLLDAKKCVRKEFSVKTGDELRKSDSNPVLPKAPSTNAAQEGLPPQDKGKEGGYDSKADVVERTEGSAVSVQPEAAIRQEDRSDKKEESKPVENSEGKPYGDATTEEFADADNKKFKQENYEEDRIGRITERANYPESIKVHSVVTKTMKNGSKMVGQVLKVYTKKDQTGLLVKWTDGRFEHVNAASIDVLSITEKSIAGILTEAAGVGLGVAAGDVGAAAITSALKHKQPKKPIVEEKVMQSNDIEKPNDAEKSVVSAVASAALKAGKYVAGEVMKHPTPFIAGQVASSVLQPNSTKEDNTEKGLLDVGGSLVGGAVGSVVGGTPGAIVGGIAGSAIGSLAENILDPAKKIKVKKSDEVEPSNEVPEEFLKGVLEVLKETTDLSDEEIIELTKVAWEEINTEKRVLVSPDPRDAIETSEGTGVKSDVIRRGSTQVGEKIPEGK